MREILSEVRESASLNLNSSPIWGCLLAAPGWVLLIGTEYEQSRVLVALLVSIAFLSLQYSITPFAR